jgi:hypothetical protein
MIGSALMRPSFLLMISVAIGCGSSGGGSGEPQNGNAMVVFNTRTEVMDVGAAIADSADPTKMIVQLGSDHVTCSLDLAHGNSFPPQGSYIYFQFDKTTPGTDTMASMVTVDFSGSQININEGSGTAHVTAIDTRVTGDLTFTKTDGPGAPINASGTFDVKKCF